MVEKPKPRFYSFCEVHSGQELISGSHNIVVEFIPLLFIAETSEIIAERNGSYGRKRGMSEVIKIDSKSFLHVLVKTYNKI